MPDPRRLAAMATDDPDRGPLRDRFHYRLTALGESLEVPLAALRLWAEENMAEIDDHREATG